MSCSTTRVQHYYRVFEHEISKIKALEDKVLKIEHKAVKKIVHSLDLEIFNLTYPRFGYK